MTPDDRPAMTADRQPTDAALMIRNLGRYFGTALEALGPVLVHRVGCGSVAARSPIRGMRGPLATSDPDMGGASPGGNDGVEGAALHHVAPLGVPRLLRPEGGDDVSDPLTEDQLLPIPNCLCCLRPEYDERHFPDCPVVRCFASLVAENAALKQQASELLSLRTELSLMLGERKPRDGVTTNDQWIAAVGDVLAERDAAVQRADRLAKTLREIQAWDCLNPPDPHFCADHPWLRRLVDEALDAALAAASETKAAECICTNGNAITPGCPACDVYGDDVYGEADSEGQR